MTLLALLLLQAAAEESLQQRVDRFLSGDGTQAAAIRSAGPSAMLMLRPHRANLKANDLMREIRQAAASAEDRPMAKRLADLKPKKVDGKATFLEALDAAMGGEVRWTFDPREFEVIGDRKVAPPSEGSGLDVLE